MTSFDIIVIGAGVVGSAIARELSRYQAGICVLEKNADVCEGTSKANSAIVHAGFDAQPGTLKAELNAAGNRMMDAVSTELDVPFKRTGAFVVCFHPEDMPRLQELHDRGMDNGINDMEILSREEALAIEPNLSDDVYAVLLAKTSGIICPFELTMGYAENAAENGVTFCFDSPVTAVRRADGGFTVETPSGIYTAKTVINAAGVYADAIHNMVCKDKMEITARRGEYLLLDKSAGYHVRHTIFQLPGPYGKGVLVTPTVHGNLIVGPTSADIDDKEATRTTAGGLAEVTEKSAYGVKDIPLRDVITSFSGLRAHTEADDFIIQESADGFFDAAAIESPGLSAAPAIALRMARLVSEKLRLAEKDNFEPIRKKVRTLSDLPYAKRAELIKENPAYGAIVCRCEEVSEGEILAAIHRPLGARTLDGVKRRTRAGMGRCQSGFCSPRVMEILARELKLDLTEIRKNSAAAQIVYGKTRGEEQP